MKVIITGATGMVGKSALLECLEDQQISQVLLINRRSIDMDHPKIRELIHQDFFNFDSIKDQLKAYDACFHCMGVTSAGKSEEEYNKLTFTVTEALANALADQRESMVFIYVSGLGTDSSEQGAVMWARVKGKTENYILNFGFKDAYAFRPGAILPQKGIKSGTGLYNAFYVVLRPIFPLINKLKSVITTTQIGRAMINVSLKPQGLKHLEGGAIGEAAMRT